jgi:hypothetical protein
MYQFWRLNAGGGLSCIADGLFLGHIALLDQRNGSWAPARNAISSGCCAAPMTAQLAPSE